MLTSDFFMHIYEHIFQWFKYLNIENITFPLYFTVLYVLNEINSDASNYVILINGRKSEKVLKYKCMGNIIRRGYGV
jgi:hypothetical protein